MPIQPQTSQRPGLPESNPKLLGPGRDFDRVTHEKGTAHSRLQGRRAVRCRRSGTRASHAGPGPCRASEKVLVTNCGDSRSLVGNSFTYLPEEWRRREGCSSAIDGPYRRHTPGSRSSFVAHYRCADQRQFTSGPVPRQCGAPSLRSRSSRGGRERMAQNRRDPGAPSHR